MNHEDRIRERAHRIWEEEGRPEGRHREHWERACREMAARGATTLGGAAAGRLPSTAVSGGTPGTSGLVGADDTGAGTPGAMGVDDLNVADRLNDPDASRPTTGRSKLVGS